MSKASMAADTLQKGEGIKKYKEAGNSMLPIIKSNQPVTLEPVTEKTVLAVGDVVFCKVKGNYYTHLISAIDGERYQISNNKKRVNGWITRNNIYGKVTKIWEKWEEDDERKESKRIKKRRKS